MQLKDHYLFALYNQDDVAQEALMGRIYRADYLDKQGRVVFVIKAGRQVIQTLRWELT